ncbi:MAG: flagellar hook-length control protein FliK [Rubrimonas sp.]
MVDAIIAARDGDRVELRLDPPELGRVSIGIQLEDGALRAVVAADRPETLDLLRRHADALQRELNASGFGRADLSFADHRGGGRNGREAAGRIISESEEPVPAAATGPSTVVRPAGPSDRLDIRL